ncbi:formate dehydrogenase subunit delta [Mycobacterium sp. OAS707]|uniref:formate dehydrogenase subunit delta n=1 Tax=unclassified Mycobacterium TaxID=2642494 RepID=UPI00178A190B|nr:formate dehydrogenase subunit delta [Mycobacterium sp. OAS707]MBE1547320.1 formate dehydrogenase subunit delta [Mycobacterium sp. OAS707]
MGLNAPAEIRMINNIAAHFGYLHTDQAATAVADHIRRFWDPRMKQRLLLLVASDTTDLDPVSVAAAGLLR